MKKLSNLIPGLALFLLLSCGGGSPDSVKNAKDSNDAKIDSQKTTEKTDTATVLTKDDADFLVSAISGNMMEVELGTLAQAHSNNSRVKAFGAMMVEDHGETGKKLKELGMAKKLVLPDSMSNDQKKEIESLKKKTGNDFNRAYMRLMVSDHKNDIKEYEKQARTGTDPRISNFASNTLPILQKHLDSANNLGKLMGFYEITAPPRPLTP
ncbi:MAG: DUF4142 domain-containing protein [Bacteroidetes bacterium]|nr:DUF4142 domain-containing protein [Bacteroidota bacterium]